MTTPWVGIGITDLQQNSDEVAISVLMQIIYLTHVYCLWKIGHPLLFFRTTGLGNTSVNTLWHAVTSGYKFYTLWSPMIIHIYSHSEINIRLPNLPPIYLTGPGRLTSRTGAQGD